VAKLEFKKADFERFVAQFDQLSVERMIDDLVSISDSRRYVTNGYETALVRTLCDRIGKRQPTSCIRLGDGEGDILGVGDPQYGEMTMVAAQRTVLRQFGVQLPMSELLTLRQLLSASVAAADVVGIPMLSRIRGVFRRIQEPNVDIRGSCGTINAVRCTVPLIRNSPKMPIITDCFFHRFLLPYFAEIIGSRECLGLVSCHAELPEKLVHHFSVAKIDFYQIPDEFMNHHQIPEKPHYRQRFDEVISTLRLREPGQIFLVAAGVLGKIYCHRVKVLGGIAIDIGSMADVWTGKPTLRPYQTDEFVERWKLL